MKKNINYILLFAIVLSIAISACKKTEYTFGNIVTPSNVVITTTIQGSATNPTGDGSGNITVSVTATNALAYKIYFGTGDSVLTSTGKATYKYTTLDTNTYTISVNAIGTGGATSTASKQIKGFVPVPDTCNYIGNAYQWVIKSLDVGQGYCG